MDYFTKSEQIDIAHNRKSGIAFSRHNIATVHIARDEYQQATVCLSVLSPALRRIASALELEVRPFSVKGFCEALVTAHSRQDLVSIILHQLAALGQRSRSEGDLAFSVQVLNAGCHLAIAVGDLHIASLMANEAGLAFSDAGAHEQAAMAFEEGEKASRALGDEYELVTRLNNRARSYLNMHEPNSAAEILRTAEKHARRLPDSDQLVRVLNSLAECCRKQGKTANAIAYYEELASIASQNGDFDTQIASLMGIGKCYRDDGQLRRSVEYRKRALIVAESTQKYDTAGHLSALIANTCA